MAWQFHRVADIVDRIFEGTFALPVVQRRLVWDAEKIEQLFDTLLKGHAFGGIVVLEERPGNIPLFAYRRFSLDGNRLCSAATTEPLLLQKLFVIDGQQRLQSFYIGLRGQLEHESLYFDLFSDHDSFFEFKFAADEYKLPGPIQPSDDGESRPIRERKWVKVADLFNLLRDHASPSDAADRLLESRQDDAWVRAIRRNVEAFWKNTCSEYRIGVDAICLGRTGDVTASRQQVVELFRRLNAGGTVLTDYDLFASMLKGHMDEMEAFLDDLLKKNNGLGLMQDNLIKLVFLLRGNARKEMDEVEPADATFAVNNKQRIREALDDTWAFLRKADLEDYFRAGNRSFIPIYFVAYHLFFLGKSPGYFNNFDTTNPDFPRMRDWLYHSLLNHAFRGRGYGWIAYRTGVSRILGVMQSSRGASFPLQKLLDLYRERLHSFTDQYGEGTLHVLDREFLFYLIYKGELTPLGRDFDHIHPRVKLEASGVSADKINSVANLQLIDLSTNRGTKNDEYFNVWLDNYVTDKPAYLRRHLIPEDADLHKIENFEAFLAERAKLIAARVQESFAPQLPSIDTYSKE